MTRLLGAIVYNWPLKVMAIALAALLYGALVIAQNQQSRDVGVQIHPAGQPTDTVLIGDLGEVTNVRYFVVDPTSVTVNSASFTASVDLSHVQPGPQAQSVRVIVQAADPQVQVVSATPAFVSVRIEKIAFRDVAVIVLPGLPVPDGLEIDPPEQSIEKATVRGAQSDVDRVAAVRAVIPIDPSGLDIDRDFVLVPVDVLGEKVGGVDVEPALVHVSMAVTKNRTTATVPIVPMTPGTPAAGFEVVRVTLSAPLVTLTGDADNLRDIVNAQTEPVSLDGRTTDLDVTVGFALPQGVKAVNPVTVRIHVTIRAVAETRTLNAGVVLTGARGDRTYDLSSPQALVTIGGSPVDLDRLNGAALDVSADVSGLDVGVHEVRLTMSVQVGLTVVAIAPATITITIGEPSSSVQPSASG
jgi:YbbR domain-containing protein